MSDRYGPRPPYDVEAEDDGLLPAPQEGERYEDRWRHSGSQSELDAEGGAWSAGPDEWSDYEERPRRRRGLLVAGAVAVVVVVVVGLVARWADSQIHPSRPGPAVTLSVPAGSTVSGLTATLVKRQVIGSSLLWRLYLHLNAPGALDPGQYQLRQHEAYGDVLATLARGPAPIVERLTIPEGFTLGQIGAKVGALPGHSPAQFLAVAQSGVVRSPYEPPGSNNLEGLLFPDTYTFGRATSDAAILGLMVDRFDQEAAAAGLDQAASTLGVTPYQVVTVASMVEREARVPADRGKVARVIYNRLSAGMPLQIDATVIYAAGGNSSALAGHDAKDVAPGSPYNTYRVTGLPPTPIASPGLASIQAALAPTPGSWLYYVVVSSDGTEAFSTTYAQQLANIALAQSRGLG